MMPRVGLACGLALGLALSIDLPADGSGLTQATAQAPSKGIPAPPLTPSGLQLLEVDLTAETPGKSAPLIAGVPSSALLEPPQGFLQESEPNGTSATADPLGGTTVRVYGNIFAPADVDFYSFAAATGDRVYAATQTLFDASASGDSVLELISTDGATVIETDNNDGTFNASSASIAGTLIPSPGTYFLRVRHNVGTGTIRPYHLHFRLQSGAPVAEVEANNTPATATPLPGSGWASGTITAVSPGESDFFSLALNAGDSVYLSLDMNPERDAAVWNGRLGFGLFGNPPANQILLANDANAGAGPADPNSEAFFFTVLAPGTYVVYIDSIVAAGLGANATYNLSVSVYPFVPATASCTTYTSTDVPVVLPTGPGMASSTITVPGNPRIADLDVAINLNHTFMQDLDAHLVSPAGNDNGLFTDIGAATVGGAQTLMDIGIDDEAALPFAFALSASWISQPELAYRLNWFDGEDAGGTWTLVLRDDATGDGGTLNAWSITICEPPPPPSCAPGQIAEMVYSSDFETDDGGFTHSGAGDEWERGLPSFIPLTTCASGVNCWVTDLDNSYNASSSQDLLSPSIDLTNHVAPVTVAWSQRYHIESASFDHASVDVREAGGANPTRLFEWLGATMNNSVGNPTVAIAESSGWSRITAQADAYAGLATELNFHLDGDTTVQLAGLSIDDVSVTACRPASADLSITKTDGVATATPGGSVTYTITASNSGPDPVSGATVADTFPGVLACSTTCVGAGGGTCTAGPFAGSINDAVNLPSGGSVTYTATCSIDPAATGSLMNTATVSSAIADPNNGNNSATDTDTLTPSADLAITKTDGVASAVPGGSVTYTIVASNPGLSNAPGSTVADTFPAGLTCSTTCVGAGGGTCTAGPFAGSINDVVNLPAGGSVTYTASCTISPAATGSLSNTATVAAAGGVTDPMPGNNSATDTDTLTPQADLSITKSDGLVTAAPGQVITYLIVVANAGPSAAPGSTVADTFPAAFTGATWTCSGAGGGTCTAAGAGNINDIANLPPGGSATYTVNGTIDGAFTGMLSNTATVAAGAGISDPAAGNNSATDQTDVVGGASLSATKDVSGDFSEGGAITYTVVISNTGLGAQGDNPGDEFVDVLPAGLTLVSASATSGTAVANVGTNTVTWNGSIPASGSVTITIEAVIDVGTGGQTLSNQGTINYDSDGNGTNETSATTDDPAAGGMDDPTDFVVGEPVPPTLEIPTSSTLGLVLLSLILAGFAITRLRHRVD